MLRLFKSTPGMFCDGITRREWLQVGGLGLIGLGLPSLLRAEEARKQETNARNKKAKSCIVLYLAGGPSQLDMWDMKPSAPAEIRGEFKPIATTVPGIQVSELMPKLAQQAQRFALIRSAHHGVAVAHCSAVYCTLTGDDRGDLTDASGKFKDRVPGFGPSPTDNPAIGSVLSMVRPPERPIVPFVSLPYVTAEGVGGPPQGGLYGGWLGRAFDPLFVTKDPNQPNFQVTDLTLIAGIDPPRLDNRSGLLQQINEKMDAFARSDRVKAMDRYQQRAFSLLTSDANRKAFDIAQESPKLRDSYGRNIYGQSTLLARRLVEAGTRMVTLKWAPDANSTWDTHGNNFKLLRKPLLPQLDMALSTLLQDLHDRGLLDETLVLCMGEFGRSPKVNAAAGRDHWPYCYSLLLAGGGLKGGTVYGQSDKIAGTPAETPVTPPDILATVYHLLGIPPEIELPDQLGRPIRLLSHGRVIQELLA